MQKNASSGFVLITVLVFIQIFSIISLYSLIYAFDSLKRNNHQWTGDINRLTSHMLLQQLETRIATDQTACVIAVTPAPQLAQKPISWWQQHACSDNVRGIRYYYAIEFLGDDPCGVIKENAINQSLIAKFYRITLYLLPDKLKGAKYIIQSSIVLPGVQTSVCEGKLHTIYPGRQMWREIDL